MPMSLFYLGQEFAGATGLFSHLFHFILRGGDLPVEDKHMDQVPTTGQKTPKRSR
jgi:hypothetical protein